ncbi:futalosine hydrolase [Marinithermus hydrothermalis]|uniref:Futalosine hydrolase n=1 Tax=Marinithermus hydrothermalis (strain DSM 14884 / JCM 11576 / T1) TaxID=869210 RepID=F2NLN4_MARHT|nr:futalosine hydrolase [Marinithermus hydrothermalis]AEB10864.1 futalosine nucleosidase [Marinithermus hydrothermalis DSM 14884]
MLLLSATPREAAFLEAWAEEAFTYRGRKGLKGAGWVWLETGIGKVNAAMTLAAYAQAHPVDRVLMIGIGGAYPGSGLEPGALALASEEVQADLGLVEGGMAALGFPTLVVAGEAYHNRFPTDPDWTRELAEALGLTPVSFLTRDLVSETLEEARAWAERWGAAVENMEGAGAAQACRWLGLPFAELRAISNPAGVRDRRAWRLSQALGALEAALAALLR